MLHRGNLGSIVGLDKPPGALFDRSIYEFATHRVALPPNIVAWDAGGGAIAAITQDGEVWTCGAVLGQHGPKYRFLRFVEELCWRLGWKVQWQYDRPRIVREQPWQLRNVDPKD